jgi:homoserine dehydrogenase
MDLRFAFIGFGNVARAFARILLERQSQLASDYDLRFRVVAIATGTHGGARSTVGIDLNEALACVESNRSLATIPGPIAVSDSLDAIDKCDVDVVFETTPLNPADGQPAIAYIRRALDHRIHVITANKGPIAFAFRELSARARERGVWFRFEGTVMDGAPVFNLVEYCLPAARVIGFTGLLNSTTNIILSRMESGASFAVALDEARRLGIAEANSDYDIDGWDAAVKAVAIANVLMGADARPADVERRGIREVTAADVQAAAQQGLALRLIASGEHTEGGLRLRVAPERVSIASPLGSAQGATNALVLKTDLMGDLTIVETDPGVEQTAYALLSDLLRIRAEMRPND